jgi:hypothetical protein
MKRGWGGLTLLSAMLFAAVSLAQTPVSPIPLLQPPANAHPTWRLAPAGSEVLVELAELVGTRGHRPGDHFKLRLSEPLVVGDRIVIPAGATGEGEIIDVARPGMAGRPAKLILAARYVETGGTRVTLHAFRLGGVGESRKDTAAALSLVPYAGVLALAIPGGDLVYPPGGARARARILADVMVPPPDPDAALTTPSTGATP